MGPYCQFCQTRCFVYFPKDTPKHILTVFDSSTIIASCKQGQAFERQKTGYSLDDIRKAIQEAEQRVLSEEDGDE